MKKYCVLSVIVILVLSASSQDLHLDIAKSCGGSSSDIGSDINIDNSGSIILTGSFDEIADFDPGNGEVYLTSKGGVDYFIQKLNKDGSLNWVHSFGSNTTDFGNLILTDESGNIYTLGGFSFTVDFDPGASIFNLTSNGFLDIFIQKLDSSGNFIWAKSFGSRFHESFTQMTWDPSGNILISGVFEHPIDVDPGPGTFFLNTKGEMDALILKLDSDGEFIWAKSVGGSFDDGSSSITSDIFGNVLITGNFQGTVDFNPGSGMHILNSKGTGDGFILKLDSEGNFIWVKSISGHPTVSSSHIVIDNSGDVIISGHFSDSADFDPGPGSYYLYCVEDHFIGVPDVFILKVDSNGIFKWAKSFGGKAHDRVYSLKIDNDENIYLGGWFSDTANFDPGYSDFKIPVKGPNDAFIYKSDKNGNFIWAISLGGKFQDEILSIFIDQSMNLYATGYFQDTVDFDPRKSVFNLVSNGNIDFMIVKYNPWPLGGESGDTDHPIPE